MKTTLACVALVASALALGACGTTTVQVKAPAVTTTPPTGSPSEVPGGYKAFETQLAKLTVGPSWADALVECVLPPRWRPGATFQCEVFITTNENPNGQEAGTATVTIMTPNPGQATTWTETWAPSS